MSAGDAQPDRAAAREWAPAAAAAARRRVWPWIVGRSPSWSALAVAAWFAAEWIARRS